MSDTLYEDDFLLWTEAQAQALRARALGANALDYDNLAEEVEALGRSEVRSAESYTIRILEHLHLHAASQQEQPKGHWKVEIANFRTDLHKTLTRTFRRRVEDNLEQLHLLASRAARVHLAV